MITLRLKVKKEEKVTEYLNRLFGKQIFNEYGKEDLDDDVQTFCNHMHEHREHHFDAVTFATNLNLINQLLIAMTSVLNDNL